MAARNSMTRRVVLASVAALASLPLASCGDPPPPSAAAPTKEPVKGSPTGATPATAPPKPTDPMTTPANPTLPIEKVTITGKVFKLELAATDEQRFHGLSGRAVVPADGGMLFVFPPRHVARHGFLMRDCPVPIDIIYLDTTGRIVGTHKMVPEPPRSEAEKVLAVPPGTPQWNTTNEAYEGRLKKYMSTYPAQFVIELAGGSLDTLNLKDGQKIELDMDRLKKLAK